jgi:hypothetical protein
MIPLVNKTNTTAPDSDFPFGGLKNDTGTGDGTPADVTLLSDSMQFFEKLMSEAGITPNGLPDNEYSGWQLFQALMAIFGGVKRKIVQIGAWNMDSTATASVAHGLPDNLKIRNVAVMILNDDLTAVIPFVPQGNVTGVTATDVLLNRDAAGQFDDVAFNDALMNRGFILIDYID